MSSATTNQPEAAVSAGTAFSTVIFMDRFSEGLDDLTQKQQRSEIEVLKCLSKMDRFSIFEATANQGIAGTMDSLMSKKLITVDNSCGFPWSTVSLTPNGLAMIGQ